MSFVSTTEGFHNVSSVPRFLFNMLAMLLSKPFILWLFPTKGPLGIASNGFVCLFVYSNSYFFFQVNATMPFGCLALRDGRTYDSISDVMEKYEFGQVLRA